MGALTEAQERRISRQIERHGLPCTISRAAVNDFGEPTDTEETIYDAPGLYHLAGGHLQITLEDKGTTQDRKTPMVLIPYHDDIRIGDTARINGTEYRVTGVTDIGNEHAFLDVSLGGAVDD